MSGNRKNPREMKEEIVSLEEANKRFKQQNTALRSELTDLHNKVREYLVESAKLQNELFALFINNIELPHESLYRFRGLPSSQFCPGGIQNLDRNFVNTLAPLKERDENEDLDSD